MMESSILHFGVPLWSTLLQAFVTRCATKNLVEKARFLGMQGTHTVEDSFTLCFPCIHLM